jgi:hypothetical protein
MMCEKGCLLDVVEKTDRSSSVRRHLFCMAGMENPEECVYRLAKKIKEQKEQELQIKSETDGI